MDDLIIYITTLLESDEDLLAIFQVAGQEEVSVVEPDGRAAADYPRIIIEGDDGEIKDFAENAPPVFINTELRLEIVTATSEDCPDKTETLRQILTRCGALLAIKGLKFTGDSGQKWCLTKWRQKNARYLPVTNPKYKRHQTKFEVQLYKTI